MNKSDNNGNDGDGGWFYRLMAGRAAFIAATLLAGYFLFGRHEEAVYSLSLPAGLGVAGLLLTPLYAIWYRLKAGRKWIPRLQTLLDTMIVGLIVLWTGAVASPFTFLYPLVIISACLVDGRRGGTTAALSGTVFYAAIFLFGLPYRGGLAEALFTFFVNMAAFNITAILGMALVQRLRYTETRLSRTVADLRRIEDVQRHVADSLRSGLITVDENGVILTFNKAAREILGEGVALAYGRPLAEVWPKASGLLGGLDLQSRAERFEFEYGAADGRAKIIGISFFKLLDDKEAPLGFGLLFQDITESRARDEILRRMERLASLGEMAAGLAHEIRNPLASLSGAVEFMKEEGFVRPEGERLLEIILRESGRLNGLTDAFLLYARPEGRRMSPLSVREELGSSLALIGRRKDIPKAAVEIDVPDGLVINADPGQFRQVIFNLLLNAYQSVPDDGGKISIIAGDEGRCIDISISDNGRGIKKQDLARVFDPFFTTRPDGTGLGLAIVHRLVQVWGGEI
ncbi:MAG: ATP-binding protein, partial [Desulfobacteraceae bacterium]|nr:ATP-binding protein [Desulfobacteraceae bacterium]